MVGLVIVSHSRSLAEALVHLVRQMAGPDVPIAIAAGVGPDRVELGTDATEIMAAIESVATPDGVLVMMDLGSAILSAELAVELLPPETASLVRFCPAPLVEGSLAAAVQIGLDSSLETVFQEAQAALTPKTEQLGLDAANSYNIKPGPTTPPPATADFEERQSITLTLTNNHGLHARPAARFVQTAARFGAYTRVTNLTTGKGPVPANSLNAVATLGAVQGHQIQVEASGPDAAQTLAALSELVQANFGEPQEPAPEQAPQTQPTQESPDPLEGFSGLPVSAGFAVGPLFHYQPVPPPIPTETAQDPEQEWQRLQRSLENVQRAIGQRQAALRGKLNAADSAIFDAHRLILADPELLEQARRLIFSERLNASAAWSQTTARAAAAFQALADSYLQQRGADVQDVGNQVLLDLAGKGQGTALALPGPVILFARDLTPTETAQLDLNQVLGLLLETGGTTSHSAILARALSIPAISGVGPEISRLPAGTQIGLDGSSGQIWVEPTNEEQADLLTKRQAWQAQRQALVESSQEPAQTRDGRRVEVFANVGNGLDVQAARQNGAEGIGLLRTEFLFLTRDTAPSEDEQVQALLEIGLALEGKPVTVRTLDVGGDKPLPYIDQPVEANPFLGVRALRLSLAQPNLFLVQLRAILRAAASFPVRVMFPMVAILDEVLQARRLLEQAHQDLLVGAVPHGWPVETGVMIEIPSAALLSRGLAAAVDFFSIGTNDLTQYTLAAERGSPHLAHLTDGLNPAVLRLIGEVVQSAHTAGKWVGVCGELAGDPLAAAVLIGLGVDELSLNPGGIPAIKAAVRSIDTTQALDLAQQALQLDDAPQVRRLLQAKPVP